MVKTLKEIANIKFGLHAQSEDCGEVMYLQAGHFSNKGKLLQIPTSFIGAHGRIQEHMLEDGDILLAGKGNRNFAWCYRKGYGPAVASSIFFVIQPRKDIVYPEYLTAYFNLEKCQLHFRKLGEGSNVASIRKSELGELNIPILTMKKQLEIAAISKLHEQQTEINEKIQQHKYELYEAVMNNLTTGK
jgi:restriction endonuclease S subunit